MGCDHAQCAHPWCVNKSGTFHNKGACVYACYRVDIVTDW